MRHSSHSNCLGQSSSYSARNTGPSSRCGSPILVARSSSSLVGSFTARNDRLAPYACAVSVLVTQLLFLTVNKAQRLSQYMQSS
jgi:hypothetical protein